MVNIVVRIAGAPPPPPRSAKPEAETGALFSHRCALADGADVVLLTADDGAPVLAHALMLRLHSRVRAS